MCSKCGISTGLVLTMLKDREIEEILGRFENIVQLLLSWSTIRIANAEDTLVFSTLSAECSASITQHLLSVAV